MPRELWPPEYVNAAMHVLLDGDVPDGAFRFYCKLRALAWGEGSLSLAMKSLMEESGLGQTRIYEYARILRLHRGLLSYAVRNDVFECSFPTVSRIPGIREKPNALSNEEKTISDTSSKQRQKTKPGVSRIPGIRENGAVGTGAGTNAIKDEYVRLLGFKPHSWAEGEAKAAQKIGEQYTVEQFAAAYSHYKGQNLWRDRRLALRWLVGNIADFLAFKKRETTHGANGSKRSDPPGGRQAEPISEAQRIARRLSGGGNVEDDHGSPRQGG